MGIRVYEYGCGRGEIEGLASAIEQMRRRTEFWNRLVEIDNDIRARMEALLFAGKLETELNSMREELGNVLRSGPTERPDEDDAGDAQTSPEIGALRSAIRTRLDEVKRIRKANAAVHRAELRVLDAERKRRITEVQAGAGLYWANRDEIRRKYEGARAQAMRQGRQLRPQTCDDTGRIKVQFQRGLPVPKAFLRNGRLQIDPVKDSAWRSRSRAERRRATRTRIRIRVSANEDRTPVWISVPAVLHRPLPHDGLIRGVSLVRERIGLAWRHRVLITVSEPFPHSSKSDKAVGVDLGWRLIDEGLRVAYWVGEDGRKGELVLPNSDLSEFKRIGSLQATIVAAHEEARAAVRAWVVRHGKPNDLQDLVEEALHSASPSRMLKKGR
jgi:hypothetical protein